MLVMLYLAIGLPVVHSLLHHNVDEDPTHSESCPHHHETEHEEQAAPCPICKFLSTSPWFASGQAVSFVPYTQLGTIIPIEIRFAVEGDTLKINPRAPPISVF